MWYLRSSGVQVAEAVRVKAVMGALSASLLRLDGMLTMFGNVTHP